MNKSIEKKEKKRSLDGLEIGYSQFLSIVLGCVIAIFFALSGCKEKEAQKSVEIKPGFKPEAMVLFVLGDVKVGERQLKTGDIVSEMESVKTGKKSACDVQILGLESDVTIRLRENTEFLVAGYVKNEVKKVQMKMVSGKILVNTQKLNAKESIEAITPTSVAGVRGTKFEVEIKKDSSNTISVLEGTVAVKVAIPEIEALPEEVKANSKTLQNLDAYLIEKEVIIESGNSSTVTKKYAEKVLKETGIGDVIKNSDKSTIVERLDNLAVKEKMEEKFAKLKDAEVQAPVAKVATKTFEDKLKEYEEIIAIEKTKLSDPNLKAEELKKRMKSPELMKRIEDIMEKSAETLILKSGERVQGIIFLEGDKYIVLTPEGRKDFATETVVEVEL